MHQELSLQQTTAQLCLSSSTVLQYLPYVKAMVFLQWVEHFRL